MSVGARPAAAATEALVIGDSLGVGVSLASGIKRLAKNSVSIRGGGILSQIEQAPARSTVFMSLGTNDAVGRIEGLDGEIARIVATARSAGVKLVWIGPPCVTKDWDERSEKLDAIIRARTAGTGVTYVSTRDRALCAPGLRAKDGVHLTMRGYGLMWAKARSAAGLGAEEVRLASAEPARAVEKADRRAKVAVDGGEPDRKAKKRRETRMAAAAAAPAETAEEPKTFGDWFAGLFLRRTASAGD